MSHEPSAPPVLPLAPGALSAPGTGLSKGKKKNFVIFEIKKGKLLLLYQTGPELHHPVHVQVGMFIY